MKLTDATVCIQSNQTYSILSRAIDQSICLKINRLTPKRDQIDAERLILETIHLNFVVFLLIFGNKKRNGWSRVKKVDSVEVRQCLDKDQFQRLFQSCTCQSTNKQIRIQSNRNKRYMKMHQRRQFENRFIAFGPNRPVWNIWPLTVPEIFQDLRSAEQ